MHVRIAIYGCLQIEFPILKVLNLIEKIETVIVYNIINLFRWGLDNNWHGLEG
jgi:hypothetical protein